jgi:hypothetical protein
LYPNSTINTPTISKNVVQRKQKKELLWKYFNPLWPCVKAEIRYNSWIWSELTSWIVSGDNANYIHRLEITKTCPFMWLGSDTIWSKYKLTDCSFTHLQQHPYLLFSTINSGHLEGPSGMTSPPQSRPLKPLSTLDSLHRSSIVTHCPFRHQLIYPILVNLI